MGVVGVPDDVGCAGFEARLCYLEEFIARSVSALRRFFGGESFILFSMDIFAINWRQSGLRPKPTERKVEQREKREKGEREGKE